MSAMHVVPRDDWEWSPGKLIGPIALGEEIGRYLKPLRLTQDEIRKDGDDVWKWYNSPSRGILVLTINDRIVSVTCSSCIYRGKNLVGMSESELIREIGVHYEVWNHALGRMLEFDEVGLDAQLDNDIVEKVTVSIDPDLIPNPKQS